MPKIRIVESATDPLLISSGKGKVVVDKGFDTSALENSSEDSIKIRVLSSEIKEDDEGAYEVAKVRIDSPKKQGSRLAISTAIQAGSEFTNHQISIPKLLDINQINNQNISKATPSYSMESAFNYVAQDYDNLQISVNELNLASPAGPTVKDDILNFRKKKNAKVLDFSKGTRLKNFVQAQEGFGGLEGEIPYYNRIQINENTNGGLSKFAQRIQIYDEVLSHYLSSDKSEVTMNIQNEDSVSRDVFLGVYGLTSFLSEDIALDTDNFYGLNESNLTSKMGLDLRKHLLKGYLKSVSKSGFRRFEDIRSNVSCYREAFAYSAEKFDSFLLESTKVQTLFAPAGQESTHILDSQVKYGKTYIYRVSAHYMILGNSYRYENVRYFEEDGITYATASVINKPSYVIVPVEIFTEQKTIIQPPPVTPQVIFKTENNSEDEIQIYLSPTKTEVREPFIQITNEDEKQKEDMDKFFKGSADGFKFATTTQSGLYEVFRTEEPPTGYSNFANKKLGEIRMPFSDTDAVLFDKVSPNKFYYYICRQMNQKELASNPTSVFKVMLVKDADDSKVTIDTHQFPEPVVSQSSRELRSLIQVRPALEQILFNDTQDSLFQKESLKGTLDGLKLGISEKSVWGRKIKLRVKSKTSGKIVDLNIDFNLAKNKTKEEF
jgi:hypothetical protein